MLGNREQRTGDRGRGAEGKIAVPLLFPFSPLPLFPYHLSPVTYHLSMLDLRPRSLNVERWARFGCVTTRTCSCNVRDSPVPFCGLCHVSAAGAVALLALHALHSRELIDFFSSLAAGRMAIETTHLKLECSRHQRITRPRMRAVSPLHILTDVALTARITTDVISRNGR